MLKVPFPDTEIYFPGCCENPEVEWQTGAIPTRIGEYQATLNDLPMFVLLARILDWTIVKRCSRLDIGLE